MAKPATHATGSTVHRTMQTVSLQSYQQEVADVAFRTYSAHDGVSIDIANSRTVPIYGGSIINIQRGCQETQEEVYLNLRMHNNKRIKMVHGHKPAIDDSKTFVTESCPFDDNLICSAKVPLNINKIDVDESKGFAKEKYPFDDVKGDESNRKYGKSAGKTAPRIENCSVSVLSGTDTEFDAGHMSDHVTRNETLGGMKETKGETFTSFEESDNKSIPSVETLVNAHLNEIENDKESGKTPAGHIAECMKTGLDCEEGEHEDNALNHRGHHMNGEIIVCTDSLFARNSLANSNISLEDTQEKNNNSLHNVNEDFWQKNCDKGQVEDSALVSTTSNPEKDTADTTQREPMKAVVSGVAGGGYKEAASKTGSLSAEMCVKGSDKVVEHNSPTSGDDLARNRDVQISKGSVQSLQEDGIISSVGTTEKDITPQMETLQYRIERGINPQPASCNLHEISRVYTASFGMFCHMVEIYLPIVAATLYTDSSATFLLFLFMIPRLPQYRFIIVQGMRILISASALTRMFILLRIVLSVHCFDDDSPFYPDSAQPLSDLQNGHSDFDSSAQDSIPTNHHAPMQEGQPGYESFSIEEGVMPDPCIPFMLVLIYMTYLLSKDWMPQRSSLLTYSNRRRNLFQEISIDDNKHGPIPDGNEEIPIDSDDSNRLCENEGEGEGACGGYRNHNSPRYSDSGIGTIYNFPSVGTTQIPGNSHGKYNFHQHPQSTVLCTLPPITPPRGSSLFDVQPEVDSDQHTRRHLGKISRIVDQNMRRDPLYHTTIIQNFRRSSSPDNSRAFDEHSRRSHSADEQSRAFEELSRRSPENARYQRQTLFWRRSRSHDDTITRRPQRVDYHRGHSLPAPSTVFTFDKGHDLASVSSAIVEDPSVRDGPTDSRYAVITVRHQDSHGHCHNQAAVHCPPDCTIQGILPQVTSKIREQFLRGRDAASVSLHLVIRPVTACRLSQEQPQPETRETTDHGPEVCVASWEDPGITLHTAGGDTVPVALLPQVRLEEEVGADGRVFIARELTHQEDKVEWKGPISEDESGFTGGVVKDLQTDNHDDTDDDSEPENFARGFGSYFKRR